MEMDKEAKELIKEVDTKIKELKKYFTNTIEAEIEKYILEDFFVALSLYKADLSGLKESIKYALKKEKDSKLVNIKAQYPKRTLTDIDAQINVEQDDLALLQVTVLLKQVTALLEFLNNYITLFF